MRQSSGSSLAARPVEPTRSKNRTAIGRRSAAISKPSGGADLDEGGGTSAGVAPDKAAIASSSLRRSPTAETPTSLRSSAVSRGNTSASILLSRNFSSYCPRRRPRSHSPTSMAALHMAQEDIPAVLAACPAGVDGTRGQNGGLAAFSGLCSLILETAVEVLRWDGTRSF